MVGTAASGEGCPEGFAFQLLPTHDSTWEPNEAQVTLSARLDARLVPSPASPLGDCSGAACSYAGRSLLILCD